jgi:small basic protein (TIGR04137 family)
MSQHNSFKASAGGGKKNRTVLKRFERVDLLRKTRSMGRWQPSDRSEKDQAGRVSQPNRFYEQNPLLNERVFSWIHSAYN